MGVFSKHHRYREAGEEANVVNVERFGPPARSLFTSSKVLTLHHRIEITDGNGNVLRTNEVTLTYVEPVTLVITKQPQSATVATGKSATFSVEATGENLTYLWEYKRVTDTSWKTWKSKTTPTMTVPYDASRDGMQLRCKITDGQGNVIRSVEVTLNYQ